MLQDQSATQPFSIQPISDVLGGEIVGFDVRDLAPGAQIEALRETLRDKQVLVFRDQDLTPAELTDFVRLIGDPQYSVLKQWQLPGRPEIDVLSNVVEDGRAIGNAYTGLNWHSDLLSNEARRTYYTVLYGLEVPEVGGGTNFASMYQAYEALPEARQRELDGMRMIYSYERLYNSRRESLTSLGVDHGYKPLTDEQLTVAQRRQINPIVDTDPRSGRKWLHLATGGCVGVEGMPDEEGVKLVRGIIDYATSPRFRYDHAWRVRDLVIWDNHGLFHVAADYDRTKQRRLLHRCSIAPRLAQ